MRAYQMRFFCDECNKEVEELYTTKFESTEYCFTCLRSNLGHILQLMEDNKESQLTIVHLHKDAE